MMTDLSPIEQTPLYKQVADKIQRYIHSNELKPGDRLPSERELGERLQVSRTVVREALRMLSIMGLVRIRIGQGAFVGEPEMSELLTVVTQWIPESELGYLALLEAREALEVYAAGLAAERANPEDLAYMEEILQGTQEKIEGDGDVLEEDLAFHQAIFEAASNPVLIRLLRIIGEGLVTTRQQALQAGNTIRDVLEDHRTILTAIRNGTSKDAADAMKMHLAKVKDVIRAMDTKR